MKGSKVIKAQNENETDNSKLNEAYHYQAERKERMNRKLKNQ